MLPSATVRRLTVTVISRWVELGDWYVDVRPISAGPRLGVPIQAPHHAVDGERDLGADRRRHRLRVGYQFAASGGVSPPDAAAGIPGSGDHRVFQAITDGASIVTHGATAVNATRDFSAAFAELQSTPLARRSSDSGIAVLHLFGPDLAQRTGKDVDPKLFEPTSNAAIYLQNAYTVPAQGDFEKALATNTAGDPSSWSAANSRYQPFFADITTRFGFEDALILNTSGDVVYTAFKGVDLGTNLLNGPYKTTRLADSYRQAVQAVSVDETFVTDFERYAPSLGMPTLGVDAGRQ